jgi:hypothetical protein
MTIAKESEELGRDYGELPIIKYMGLE